MNDEKKLEQSEEKILREWEVSKHQINALITNSKNMFKKFGDSFNKVS